MPYLKLDLEYITVKVKVTGESKIYLSAIGLLAYWVGGREKKKEKEKKKKKKQKKNSSVLVEFNSVSHTILLQYEYTCMYTSVIEP